MFSYSFECLRYTLAFYEPFIWLLIEKIGPAGCLLWLEYIIQLFLRGVLEVSLKINQYAGKYPHTTQYPTVLPKDL